MQHGEEQEQTGIYQHLCIYLSRPLIYTDLQTMVASLLPPKLVQLHFCLTQTQKHTGKGILKNIAPSPNLP